MQTKDVAITNGNKITYYNNLVGYINKDNDKAIIDPIFERDELIKFFKEKNYDVVWEEGIYESISNGEEISDSGLKMCRIYQLKSDVDIEIKFISYKELLNKGGLNRENYAVVYEGQIGTNDLDEIFTKLNTSMPDKYNGHSLSMSDIIELYDETGASEFYYVDRFGFEEVTEQMLQEQRIEKNQSYV